MTRLISSVNFANQINSHFYLEYFRGIPTNNNAEGYNSRLANKKTVGKHPNVYLLSNKIWKELREANDDAISILAGTGVKYLKKSKFKKTKKRREGKSNIE